jgi:CubicO group peptidase (beta-lactamase class C family)
VTLAKLSPSSRNLKLSSPLGKADVASGRATTAETLYRIGSTSKGFASLSILMLADQGKLSLDDPVHKLAPEVWFDNRWEASDPVRVVHLLEHTTGWDDIHLREFAKDAPGMGLREALDYDHHSRTSRWRPGTRMAYCNSGPAVAAYIVEKLTGQHFEDFVEQNLFPSIGMKTATYFEPAPGTATTLYHHDGKTPYRYWNLLFRPSGSINASANDMAAYLQFYLNRGAVKGKRIVPAADIDRMEIPASTWAARDGMKTGYGLSNFRSLEDGFIYHGHDGGVAVGTEMAYMPDYGVGIFQHQQRSWRGRVLPHRQADPRLPDEQTAETVRCLRWHPYRQASPNMPVGTSRLRLAPSFFTLWSVWLALAGFASRTASSFSLLWGDGMRHIFPSPIRSSVTFARRTHPNRLLRSSC